MHTPPRRQPAEAPQPTFERRLRVTGIVQGVGFRPYVWRLAQSLRLGGWVRNDGAGVDILVRGAPTAVEAFTRRLPAELPPRAQLRGLDWQDLPDAPAATEMPFAILASQSAGTAATLIGPDSAVCADCLAELFDPANRRWRHAFITCSHCGPRYTLTRKIPYDRAQTSMAGFAFCPECAREYHDPADRRFHAETLACPACGPRLMLTDADGRPLLPGETADPIAATLARLLAGDIVALKGLGGFHLACDAQNAKAVARLRARKGRADQPLALMAARPETLAGYAHLPPAAIALLESPERPIVLLDKKPGADLPGIAPDLAWLGALLPYTPIHWLLFHEAAGRPAGTAWLNDACGREALLLVMTSANPHGEPLVIDNAEARARLAGLADAFLLHDRDIVVRTDDSLLMPGSDGAPQFIRRARGYTPRAIRLTRAGPSVLALGGHLKTTICVTRGDEAFLSQHIGGLDNPAACAMHDEVTRHLLDLLEVEPVAVAHDLHPDFYSTRQALAWAKTHAIPALGVQHHQAHLAAVAAEHGAEGPLLGLALDGNGLGQDGRLWGGELLALDGARFTRLGHLAPLPLPGGEAAARQPWRMAAALLFTRGRTGDIVRRYGARGEMLMQLLAGGVHCPMSTSLGRVFDAAAGLLGVCAEQHYEGQAAMQLESLAARQASLPPYSGAWTIADGVLDLAALLEKLADADDAAAAAARFHATLAEALATWLGEAAARHGMTRVALAGGCLLNRILVRALRARLAARGLDVLEARQAPPNDGGLSLGQAWAARHTLMEGNPPCVSPFPPRS